MESSLPFRKGTAAAAGAGARRRAATTADAASSHVALPHEAYAAAHTLIAASALFTSLKRAPQRMQRGHRRRKGLLRSLRQSVPRRLPPDGVERARPKAAPRGTGRPLRQCRRLAGHAETTGPRRRVRRVLWQVVVACVSARVARRRVAKTAARRRTAASASAAAAASLSEVTGRRRRAPSLERAAELTRLTAPPPFVDLVRLAARDCTRDKGGGRAGGHSPPS